MTLLLTTKPDPHLTRQRLNGRRRLITWLPPLVAMLAVACESTNTFSAEHTSRWLRPVIEQLFGTFSENAWRSLHHLIRKTGHFLGYGTVCLSFLFTWLWEFARRLHLTLLKWRAQSALAAVISTALVASLDEWHQSRIPSRTGMASDALLDTVGGIVMITILWVVVWHPAGREVRHS